MPKELNFQHNTSISSMNTKEVNICAAQLILASTTLVAEFQIIVQHYEH
jgi:hypothetical protein